MISDRHSRLTAARHWTTPRWIAALFTCAGVAAATVQAWSPQGHRLVALVVTNHLTPTARQNVSSLLGGTSLADVAVWADQYLEGNQHVGQTVRVRVRFLSRLC